MLIDNDGDILKVLEELIHNGEEKQEPFEYQNGLNKLETVIGINLDNKKAKKFINKIHR